MAIDPNMLLLAPSDVQQTYLTQALANQAAAQAQSAAQTAYLQAQAANLGESIAIQKAQEAFDEVYKTASLTGVMPNGTQTLGYGNLMGTLNGQPTLAGIAQQAALTGLYQGNPTEAARQFNVEQSGLLNGAPTVNEQQVQNTAANNYLSLLASLRSPANAFQYAKVLNGTPQGLVDIVNAASGRLNMPNAGGGNVASSVNTQNPAGASIGANGQLVTSFNSGARQVAPLQSAGPQTVISDVNNPGQAQPPVTAALPAPNKIDPLAWQRFSPTQKALLSADYQSQGWDPNDVDAMRQAALPQYGGAKRGGITGLWS